MIRLTGVIYDAFQRKILSTNNNRPPSAAPTSIIYAHDAAVFRDKTDKIEFYKV